MKKSEKQKLLALNDVALNKAVKIKGTDFDRRRKLSVKDVEKIKRKYNKGVTQKDLADEFGVSIPTIRYHVNSRFKFDINYMRSFYRTVPSKITPKDLANYKRNLIATGQLKVAGVR